MEAARAGEAGAGFAVVADEVRNLAMRAADAAKDTAELIEGTVKKVNLGTELVSSTNEAFTKVADSSSKVGELVSEIAAASNEQAQEMKSIVGELIALVGGSGNGAARRPVAATNSPRTRIHKALELATPVKRAPRQSMAVNQSAEVTPQQVIPIDDDDFKDF